MKRDRRPRRGMMVQFDWCYHIWTEDWVEYCMLLAVDDATSELMYCRFTTWESLADMIVYREWYFKKHWKPQSIYLDCHATYKVNHWEDQFDEVSKTRFERWMKRLGVNIIFAKSPQWKWRVERSYRTHQDRLIKFMRLAWVKGMSEAQQYFDDIYQDKHNQKYAVSPEEEWDAHMEFTETERLNFKRYFALESSRVLKNDWTIQYNNKVYQIKKWQKLSCWKNITVYEAIDWEIKIYSGKDQLTIENIKNKT
jgi:hypothetical protein